MTDKTKKALEAIGAVAEMTKYAYDNFLRVGFDPTVALKLASDFLIATIGTKSL